MDEADGEGAAMSELGKLAYEHSDRGYTVRCWYGLTPADDAHIEITKGEETVKVFDYPSYRIWNIAAHFHDIVNDLVTR